MAGQNKQNSPWGGNWTERKLDCFASYVRAYLTIMNKYRDKYKWKLIYFDGFAGCGGRKPEQLPADEPYDSLNLFEEVDVDQRELEVYQGAAERVVRLEQEFVDKGGKGFDFYYFIDKFEVNCTRLELKLSQIQTQGYKVFRPGDANVVARQLAEALKRDSHLKSLCFLDPFGMTIEWKTIEALAGKSIDLWILVPSGVIINRLLRKDGTLMYPEALTKFFDLNEEQLKTHFYDVHVERNLFGEEEEIVQKRDHSIQLIADLYVERLGELFPYVTLEPLVMRNRNNVPIYHFVCASFSQTAIHIAQEIIDKRQ